MTNLPVRSGMEDFKKWGDPSNGEGMILKWGRGVDNPLQTMKVVAYLFNFELFHFYS